MLRRLAAEGIGSLLLAATVIGSGVIRSLHPAARLLDGACRNARRCYR
jgi:hypothetical protein